MSPQQQESLIRPRSSAATARISADTGLIYIESSGLKDFEVAMRSVDVARRCSLANAYKRRNKVDRIHLLQLIEMPELGTLEGKQAASLAGHRKGCTG